MRIVKRFFAAVAALILLTAGTAGAEAPTQPVYQQPVYAQPEVTATPAPNAFRFRDGIRWGMNTIQVKALETEPMTERSMQNWSIMMTNGKVLVSMFTADLIFMFRENKLLMASYEFQQGSADSFQYLNGALSSVYGESKEAEPLKIKALMDAVNPSRYRIELLTQASQWTAADGTTVYLYYYSKSDFAITYVSPELGSRIYQTNGL